MARRFRPRLVPTLFALTGLAILLSLGRWQVQRHGEKKGIQHMLDTRHSDAPLAGIAAVEALPADEREYHRVRLEGVVDRGSALLIAGRYSGGQPGYNLVTPVLQGDRAALVVEGWIPQEGAEAWLDGRRDGVLEGIVRYTERSEEPAHIDGRRWRRIEPTQVQQALGYELMDWIVMVGPPLGEDERPPREASPRGGYTVVAASRPHLEYAGTWFALAAVLVVVFVAGSFKPEP